MCKSGPPSAKSTNNDFPRPVQAPPLVRQPQLPSPQASSGFITLSQQTRIPPLHHSYGIDPSPFVRVQSLHLKQEFRRAVIVLGEDLKPEIDEHRPCLRVKEVFMNLESQWTVYRTRFLVRARQLTEPMVFTDALGREQSGRPGDYLVESSGGIKRITSQALFEDIYVPLAPMQHQPEKVPAVLTRPLPHAVPEDRVRASA